MKTSLITAGVAIAAITASLLLSSCGTSFSIDDKGVVTFYGPNKPVVLNPEKVVVEPSTSK